MDAVLEEPRDLNDGEGSSKMPRAAISQESATVLDEPMLSGGSLDALACRQCLANQPAKIQKSKRRVRVNLLTTSAIVVRFPTFDNRGEAHLVHVRGRIWVGLWDLRPYISCNFSSGIRTTSMDGGSYGGMDS